MAFPRQVPNYIKDIIRLNSSHESLHKALVFNEKDALERYLGHARKEFKLDILTLTDAQGKVILRTANPGVNGDDESGDALVSRALKGQTVTATQIGSREELLKEGKDLADRAYLKFIPTPKAAFRPEDHEEQGLALKGAAPIRDAGGHLLGALYGGILLNRDYEIVDRVKEIVYKGEKYKGSETGTATIFQEDLRISTNVYNADGERAIGTRVSQVSGFAGGRVFFTLGGGDANENAVRIARHAAKKPRGLIVTRDRSYHGATYMPMALSGDARTAHQVDAEAWGVRHVPPPYAYRCPWNSGTPEECGRRAAGAVAETIDQEGAARVAAVLMEVNAGSNGIVPPENFWTQLRQVTRERGVYLVADEVMSGFGRCGNWFAWQRYGAENRPDLMTLAKGLTGAAAPLGAVVMSPEVYARIEREMFYGALTYCGHPLSCAAAGEAQTEHQIAGHILTLGVKALVGTRGIQGATLYWNEHKKVLQKGFLAPPDSAPSHAVGAGDVFGAALLAHYVRSGDIHSSTE